MTPIRNAIQFFIGLLVGGLLVMPQLQAAESVDIALDWLQSQENADGSYHSSDELVSPEYSTFESITALAQNLRTVSSVNANQVSDPNYSDTISLSRMIMANVLVGQPTGGWLTELKSRFNQDGGLGSSSFGESTVLDSATALSALLASGSASRADIDPIVAYLQGVQGADGAWRYSDGIPSVSLTAVVARSLWLSRGVTGYDVSASVLKSRQYLLSSIVPETGLWATDIDSSLVLMALYPTYADPLPLSPYVQRLQQKQLANGSWSNKVFETALAIQALNSDAADTLVSSLPTVVQGNVVDRDSGVLIQLGDVRLESPLQSYQTALVDGVYEFSDVDGGSYSLVVTADGYETKLVSSVMVTPKTTRTLNNIELIPEPTSAVLLGTVTDQKSDIVLAGVEVTVTGSDTRTVISDAKGQFSVTDLVPGEIKILVTKAGYQVSSASATAKAGQSLLFNPELKPNTVNVSEPMPDTPSTATVRFIVKDIDGAPISLARINAQHSSETQPKILSTGGNGATTWDFTQEGEIQFVVTRSGYKPLSAQASVIMGHNLNLAITLQSEDSADSGVIEDNQEPQENLPTFSELVVHVVDRNTALPIQNAAIDVLGSKAISALTDSDGQFSTTDFATEKVDIRVSVQGYLSEEGSIELFIGNRTILTVELLTEDLIDSRSSTIIGSVVTAEQSNAIAGATVTLKDSTDTVVTSWNSATENRFDLADIIPGNYRLTVTADGFYEKALPLIVNPGQTLDMGEIALQEALPAPELTGRVIDFITGEPLQGVLVALSGSDQSTYTDENGFYKLQNLELGEARLFISASGYARQSHLLSLVTMARYELNVSLSLVSGIGVSIIDTLFDQTNLQAYETIQDVITLENTTVVEKPVVLEFSLVNTDDEVVLFSKAQDKDGNTVQAPGLWVPAQATATMTLQWDTLNLAPGDYKAVYRLKTGSEGVGPNSLILHEVVKPVVIEGTEQLLSASLVSTGDLAMDVGELFKLAPVVDIQNGSNMPTDLSFTYLLRSASGQTLAQHRWSYGEINPHETSLLIELPEQLVLIPKEDEYVVEVRATVPGQMMNVISDTQIASPSIRLDINQSLSDTHIYPNSEKGITVTIQLEGKEYFGE